MLLPIVAALTVTAAVMQSRRAKALAPQVIAARQAVYDTAINEVKGQPETLRRLAVGFRDAGLTAEATMLEKRAALQELPEHIKEERKALLHRALKCKDPKVVLEFASAFEEQGSTGAAENLRKYAFSLLANPASERNTESPPASANPRIETPATESVNV